MAETVIPLTFVGALEVGRCYIITGTMSNKGSAEFARFQIGNETTKELIGTVVADGDFSLSFDYTTSSTFFKSLYITENEGNDSGYDFDITNLALKLDPDCEEEYCSECFNLDNCGGNFPTKEYLFLTWTNSDDGFGMNYTSVPLTHSLWIKGGLRNADYPYEEDYFSTSGGYNFPVYVDSVKIVEMWVEDLPEYVHDSLRLGVVHDTFTVNGVQYSKGEGGYSPDWDTPNSLLAPVIVKLREASQNTKNENC